MSAAAFTIESTGDVIQSLLPPQVQVLEVRPEHVMARVPLEMIRVADYQRLLNVAWVNVRVKNFMPWKLLTICLNLRPDGLLFVVDGQHRCELCRRMNVTDMACEIRAVPQSREYALFVELNHHAGRGVGAAERYWARLDGGEAPTMALDTLVRDCGFTVSLPRRKGTISAVSTLEDLYGLWAKSPTPDLVRDVLDVVYRSWVHNRDLGTEELVSYVRAEYLEALGLLFRKYGPSLNPTHLATRLRKIPLAALEDRAREKLVSRAVAANKATAIAKVMIELYNFKLTGNRLPLLEEM